MSGRSLAPGRRDSTAWHGLHLAEQTTEHLVKPALNLTTDITITDPENGIRGGYTSCWRRHLHQTNLSTLQMLCKTPPMRKHNQQWASLTWHTKAAQLNTNQFLNLLHDTGSFKSGI